MSGSLAVVASWRIDHGLFLWIWEGGYVAAAVTSAS
jgi:hypothetical protein